MNDVNAAVTVLLRARRCGLAVASLDIPSEEAAYAVQSGVAAACGWWVQGQSRAWKSGGASRSARQTHAALPPAGIWRSPAHAGAWPFRLRGIEAEIALRLGQSVNAEAAAALDHETARGLIDAMTVSIEVVDSRWTEALDAPPLAKLADLQSHGALVLGEWVPFDAARDWSAQVCRVRIGAQPAQPFVGTHSMGDPAWILPAWLRHATLDAAEVPQGTVVTTGTWCGLLMAQAGDTVEVVFDGIGNARLQL